MSQVGTDTTSDFDAYLSAMLAARDEYKAVAARFEASTADSSALKDAYQAYFQAMNLAISASPHKDAVFAYAIAVTTANTVRSRLTYEATLGGPMAATEDKRGLLTRKMEKWAATEKAYAELGFRTISTEDALPGVIIPGVVSSIAPVPFWDKLFVKRDEGEMAVMHGQDALEKWQQADEALVAAQVAIAEAVQAIESEDAASS